MEITSFVFNPFSENTYVLFDESRECMIVDPGCYTPEEQRRLSTFILEKQLKPVLLVNTHFHIDHVLGNKFVAESYGLKPAFHRESLFFYEIQPQIARSYGLDYESGPSAGQFLEGGDTLSFGKTTVQVIHVPGHSRDSLCLYVEESGILIAGDVLFQGSIGRTDLPGGDYDTLISGIREKLFALDGDVQVYPGHGPATSIGFERENNPFF